MRIISDPASLEELSADAGMVKITPLVAWVARDGEEVAAALEEAKAKGLQVTPRGGGTAIPSQSVGRGVILLQEGKRWALLPNGEVSCEPALVKSELNRSLDPNGRWMPIDPSSYASCTVGGMVANNSSGIRTPRYGSTVDYVTGLRVVHPGSGPVEVRSMSVEEALSSDARTRRVASLIVENQSAIRAEAPRVTKNSSGYRLEKAFHDGVIDFPKLLVGSEGTLGVVTEATFRTVTRPTWRALFIVETSLGELGEAVEAFRECAPSAVELVDKSVFKRTGKTERVAKYSRTEDEYMLFCEFEGEESGGESKVEEVASSKAGGYDPLVLQSTSDVAKAWEVRNETLTLALEIRKGGKVLLPGVEDIVLPPDRLTDLVSLLVDGFTSRGLEYISYGHAGDANLHARPLLDPTVPGERKVLDDLMTECFEKAWKLGGSMTGEHGDGMLRAKFVERQYPRTYWIMQEIKKAYDPDGMLNPGVKML